MSEPKKLTAEPGSEIDRLLDQADETGVLIERNGDVYRVQRAGPAAQQLWDEYDPEAVHAALDATAGSWADVDVETLIDQIYRAREQGTRPPHG